MVTFNDYDMDVMKEVVDSLPERFNTYDVSKHRRMLDEHRRVVGHRNYHAFVGKLLKSPTRGLGLEQTTPDGHSPACWRNRPAVIEMPDPAPRLLQELSGHGMEALSGDEAGVRHHSVGAVPEGAKTRVEVNRYERDSGARHACIQHYGAICQVCDLDFSKRYGAIGDGFINVHHTTPLSQITDHDNHTTNPLTDLVPVCPNCHAMLHRGGLIPFTVEELQHQMTQAATGQQD